MPEYQAFTGLPAEIGKARRWSALLVKVVYAILVIGVILAAILWFVNADVGALTLCTALAVSTGLMVIRQALLAERG